MKCRICDQEVDPTKPDPCLGLLPGVSAACCGHGDPDMGYIKFENGISVYFTTDCVIDWNSHDDSMNEPGGQAVKRSKLKRVDFK